MMSVTRSRLATLFAALFTQLREVAEEIRVLRDFNAIRVAKVGASLLVL